MFTSYTTIIHNSKYYKLIVRGYMFRLLMQPALDRTSTYDVRTSKVLVLSKAGLKMAP